jgi:hypothetical protein
MKKIILLFSLLGLLIWTNGCFSSAENNLSIRLRWVKAYPKENWTAVKKGLYWSLSYLGAQLPDSLENQLIQRVDSSVFVLDLNAAGFNQQAEIVLQTIIERIKNSEEYDELGCIDLARFLVLTQHSSPHYYAITGMPSSLEGFRALHPNWQAQSFWLNRSCVAKNERVIEIAVGKTIHEVAFIALEGKRKTGNIFDAEAYEVLDVMPNGQLRFGVYDRNGQLIDGSPKEIAAAGKPSKCIWCHEVIVQPLFFESPDQEGYMSTAAFGQWVDSSQHVINQYRNGLHPLVKFENKQDHTYGELLYISFMEPSAFRLSNEWGIDSTQVKQRMRGQQTHVYEEFKFLGQNYYRFFADSVNLIKTLVPPASVREPLGNEPDYIRDRK